MSFKAAEIITIGDELLIGQVVDTNSAWMAEQLNLIGIGADRITTVHDDEQEIINAITSAFEKYNLVFITGGLGPTKDDVTKKALCKFYNCGLRFDETAFDYVKKIFERKKIPMPEINRSQAEIPEKCITVENTRGTAPGMWFEENGKILISLPGVPLEMKGLMEKSILHSLKKKNSGNTIFHKTLLTTGIGESVLAEKIASWEDALPDTLKLSYLPSAGMVRLRLTTSGEDENKLKTEIENQFAQLEKIIPDFFYGYNEDTLEGVIGKLLLKNSLTLCVAESCTGGAISRMITHVPGCSAYYKGGVVAYSYGMKENALEVNNETLMKHGAVSELTVREMAEGAKKIMKADCSLATSGIAGPEGGTPEKPVGMVWIAISTPKRTVTKKFMFGKSREGNIEQSSIAALNFLRKELLAY